MTVITCAATDALGAQATTTVTPTISSSLPDGSANAPVGVAPQYPNLFTNPAGGPPEGNRTNAPYPVRPSWKVAGVDYGVGIPTNVVLKNPATMNIAGTQVDTANAIVTVTANNVVIDGFDFSLNGGWQVYDLVGNNTVIQNCNCISGSNGQDVLNFLGTSNDPSGGSGLTVQYCVIDAAFCKEAVNMSRDGPALIQYCWIKKATTNTFSAGSNTFTIQFNLIEDHGTTTDANAHLDILQTYAGGPYGSIKIQFNTFVQTTKYASGVGTQGIELSGNSNQGGSYGPLATFLNTDVGWNTMICTSTPVGAMGWWIRMVKSQTQNPCNIHDNYVDASGVGGPSLFIREGVADPPGPYNGTINVVNNTNLQTGGSIGSPI